MAYTGTDPQLWKLKIIELVMTINDAELLEEIERDARQLAENAARKPSVWDAVKPIRKGLTLEQVIQEQGTKPIDRETFFALAEEVGLDGAVEELLAELTA